MNSENFMKWVRTQLIPNLPPRAVLVVDNASYHNVAVARDPTSATKKTDMISWLVQRNIPHDPKLTKPELYEIIKRFKNRQLQYVLDTEMEKYGYRVLRLPPYHPELNPIEKIWALVKKWVAARNTTYKLADVITLANDRFATVTVEEWTNICSHVDKVVSKYMEVEHLIDEAGDDFVFTVNTGDSDYEDEFDEDSEGDDTLGVSYLCTDNSDMENE